MDENKVNVTASAEGEANTEEKERMHPLSRILRGEDSRRAVPANARDEGISYSAP